MGITQQALTRFMVFAFILFGMWQGTIAVRRSIPRCKSVAECEPLCGNCLFCRCVGGECVNDRCPHPKSQELAKDSGFQRESSVMNHL
ncbi:hypothetical protein HanPI659440_Chr08g0285461 [Helianthus annuus]|nr:hypothetical protein HanPI659440_Chr08g0285461 [Helianthus annuus]